MNDKPEGPVTVRIFVLMPASDEEKEMCDMIGRMADEGRIVSTSWLGFQRAVLPPNAHPNQIEDMRRAFYGGAQAIHTAMRMLLETGSEPTQQDMDRLTKLSRELELYVEELIFASMPTGGNA